MVIWWTPFLLDKQRGGMDTSQEWPLCARWGHFLNELIFWQGLYLFFSIFFWDKSTLICFSLGSFSLPFHSEILKVTSDISLEARASCLLVKWHFLVNVLLCHCSRQTSLDSLWVSRAKWKNEPSFLGRFLGRSSLLLFPQICHCHHWL